MNQLNEAEFEGFSIENKSSIDAKNFLKLEGLSIKHTRELLQWYRTLTIHGAVYGIFIPPIWTLIPGKDIGILWEKS